MKTSADLKGKITDAASSMGNGAVDVARNLQSHAKDAWDSVQDQTRRAVDESVAFARKHPLSTALVACGIGWIGGMLSMRRSPEPSSSLKPLHQSRGLLIGVLVACSTLLRRTFSTATHAAETVADDVKAVVKTVKRAKRKTVRKAAKKAD